MRMRLLGRMVAGVVGALVALQWTLTAQTPNLSTTSTSPTSPTSPSGGAKRPLTYDVVDYWKSIQGTRLSASTTTQREKQ